QKVLGEVCAHQLDFETSLAHFSAARALAGNSVPRETRAAIELSYWGWFSGVMPLESAAAYFGLVRRAVFAGGRPTQFAHLRLCAARVEARNGNRCEAQRDLRSAAGLLRESPHAKLESQLWLDECAFNLLKGDTRSALDAVDKASLYADQSGYFRSIVGAQVDRAHVMHAMGNLTAARSIAEAAVEAARPYRQLSVAALDCLANVLIAQNAIAEAESRFAEISNLRPAPGSKLAPHWDVLSELSSRFSLAKAKAGRGEAESIVEQGLRAAAGNRDQTWLVLMQLALA